MVQIDGITLRLTGGPLDHCPNRQFKLRLTGGPSEHRPFVQLGFVNLDGLNYAIRTKEG